MQELMTLLTNPVVWKLVGGYYVFSALVGALPMPDNESGKPYKFVFAFLNGLAANLHRVASSLKVPGESN